MRSTFHCPQILLVLILCYCSVSAAVTVQLNDGRVLSGKVVRVGGVAEDSTDPTPGAGEIKVESILVVDDGLRRTFVNSKRVRDILDDETEKPVKIRLWQNYAERGSSIGRVGRLVSVTPFDEFGRRVYSMQAAGGPLRVLQGITEITPVYTRVRGLVKEPRSYIWDMRIATSSIPRDTLTHVLRRATPPGDSEARLQLVRLYLQSERYRDARRELEAIARDFPEMDDLEDDVRQLRQLGARRILDEIELRRQAGQYQLVRALLSNFPGEEVAGATLERVRELLSEDDQRTARRQRVVDLMAEVVEQIAEPTTKKITQEIQQEIATELNESTMPRMTAFLQLADGGNLPPEQKAALAVSGWLLGTNGATDNLAVALSLADIRHKVVDYLRTKEPVDRERLLIELNDMEGSSVPRIAQLLKLLRPPLDVPEESNLGGGMMELRVPLAGDRGEVRYVVQLPPEYDPLRVYPTIVTLPGLGYTAEHQLDYWAGRRMKIEEVAAKPKEKPKEEAADSPPEFVRRGQAMRHGYITIAVDWMQPEQFAYHYSGREHQAVLAALRDALRRFAIDSDRVFLSGHDIGGDAVWDIAIAHPDLWAGAMPILARADKYVDWYWENAELLPWYFVEGEMDGGKVASSAREFDRYLKKPRFDATLVEFLGRGHEPFSDEIQRLFDWMGRKRRRPPGDEFAAFTMRPWDNFFWWLEFEQLPQKSMVHPGAWPPKRGVRAARVRARKYKGNKLGVVARAGKTTVWLSPDVVDFDKPIEVELNGRKLTSRSRPVEPDLKVLLEDARTRADRMRPFWAKVSSE